MTEHEATATLWIAFLCICGLVVVGIQAFVESNERAGAFVDRLLTRFLGEQWGDLPWNDRP